jgi:hypothetical protein
MNVRIAPWALAASLLTTSTVDAAVWSWGCMGKLGKGELIFNRGALLVLPEPLPALKLKPMVMRDTPVPDDVEGDRFNLSDDNVGLVRKMEFTSQDSPTRTLTLTERSSRQTSDHHGRVGPRDEIWTTWTKVYRYALEGERPREVTMSCGEYNLTTKGGRQ